METQRTNKNAKYYYGHGIKKNCDLAMDPNGPFVLADFARELERENARLRECLRDMEGALTAGHATVRGYDEAEALGAARRIARVLLANVN